MLINSSPEDTPNHYQVLDLPWSLDAGSELSAQHLKAAYRRALFRHHPDKIRAQSDFVHDPEDRKNTKGESTYTVDQISEAYATLSVPKLRLETIDLDDLGYDEEGEIWFKSCRCGDGRGFQIRGADLEDTSDLGELHVGCRGCSLWLRVLFGVAEESVKARVADCC
jgi:diphthamide biosynthesis protein 4